MPVMRLSRITVVVCMPPYTASMRGVMPLWMKVESPSTATVFLEKSRPRAFSAPLAMPTLAPMHRVESIIFTGGSAHSV